MSERGDPKEDYGNVSGNTGEFTDEAREAYRLLRLLDERQRGLVLCWFCSACHRYVGPGDGCTCERDE